MSRSRKEYIKVRINGKTLLVIAFYTAMMMAIGAGMKSCHDSYHIADVARAKTNMR